MSEPRIAPLGPEERTEDDVFALAEFSGTRRSEYNIFTTLARHRKAFPGVLDLTQRLLTAGGLTIREREVVIMRTAHRCGSRYEWAQHLGLARGIGVTEDELAGLQETSPGPGLAAADAQLAAAVDELLDTKTLSDATWGPLAQRFDETQLIELILLTGHYHSLALFLNAARVVPDPPD